MLEMRDVCEKCSAHLSESGEAVICSFECTFCVNCGQQMDNRCPNCGGELVIRPRRVANCFLTSSVAEAEAFAKVCRCL